MDPTVSVPTPPRSRITLIAVVALVLALIVLAGGFLVIRTLGSAHPAPNPDVMPTNPAIEDRWGVRVSQIGVTADGGLVDFRFIVIDPDKALAMMQKNDNLPVMVAEDTGQVVNSYALHGLAHNLTPGLTYFILYRNTRGAIKPGGLVTVKFGDLQLEHVPAK